MKRGRLKVLLGAAPGVGKTYAMLEEGDGCSAKGWTSSSASWKPTAVPRLGTDRGLGGAAGHHDRPRRAHRDGPRRASSPGSPGLALVDELAHTNAPGSRTRSAGRMSKTCSTPASTSSPPSTSSTSSRSTTWSADHRGAAARDHSRLRCCARPTRSRSSTSHRRPCATGSPTGTVYPAERIDAALSNYFRLGNLTALRELALLWLADEVDSALKRYRARARHRQPSGRPGNGSSSPSPAARKARPCCGAARGSPPGPPAGSCSPSTSPATTACAPATRRRSPPSERSSRPSAAATTRWSATTSRARSSTSRGRSGRHPARHRGQPTRAPRRCAHRSRHRRDGHPRVR